QLTAILVLGMAPISGGFPVEGVAPPVPTSIVAGGLHTCAVISAGTVKCWGSNTSGQLGDGTKSDRWTAVAVTGITTAIAVVLGNSHTCALISGGTVKCWGSNVSGQLGDGSNTDSSTPVAVSGITTAVAITAGGNHTCALLGSPGAVD